MPDTTRDEVIATARELDPATFDAEACAAGPGKYEGADDLALVVALDIIVSHGHADAQAGDVDTGDLHMARVGRFVLGTDSRGFVGAYTYASVDLAQRVLDNADAPAAI